MLAVRGQGKDHVRKLHGPHGFFLSTCKAVIIYLCHSYKDAPA